MPQLVARDSLTQANAVRSVARGLAGVLGPPLGGLLISVGGLALALGLDAGTFVLGALCLTAVRPRPLIKKSDSKTSYAADLREGLGYVFASSWLWVTIVIFSVVNIFVGGVTVILLPLLAEARYAGAGSLGWLFSAVAAGAIVSSVVLNQVGRLRRRGVLAYGAVAVSGLGLVGLSFAPQVLWGGAAMFVVGGSITVFGVVWETTLQALVPDEVLGRVASVDLVGSLALLPLGYLLTGYLAELYSVGQVAFAYGVGTTVLALAGLLVPAVRGLE